MGISGYAYEGRAGAPTQAYLLPALFALLKVHGRGERLFELGCGNGANAEELHKRGYSVTGIDPSDQGMEIAGSRGLNLQQGSTEEALAARFGTFPIVLSLEVVEHVYSPSVFAQRIHGLLEPGGVAIVSTPYHSYLKNLALAVSGKMDCHFNALREGGHIKFFSRKTLGALFGTVGMAEVDFARVGRIPQLAKSMIGVYRKPG